MIKIDLPGFEKYEIVGKRLGTAANYPSVFTQI
jgi:hypothetical protein